jgi:hypothetical protein
MHNFAFGLIWTNGGHKESHGRRFRLILLAIKFLSRLGWNPACMHTNAFGLQFRIGERPL